jgi:hypothetical protein
MDHVAYYIFPMSKLYGNGRWVAKNPGKFFLPLHLLDTMYMGWNYAIIIFWYIAHDTIKGIVETSNTTEAIGVPDGEFRSADGTSAQAWLRQLGTAWDAVHYPPYPAEAEYQYYITGNTTSHRAAVVVATDIWKKEIVCA